MLAVIKHLMVLSGHAHSDRQHYDMACGVTRERALNVAKNWGVCFLYGAYSPGGMILSRF